MKLPAKKTWIKMGLVACATVAIVSCDGGYYSPDEYDVSSSVKKNKVSVPINKNVKPSVKFPARLAVVKVESGYDGALCLANNQQVEREEYKETFKGLHGLAGVVNMNNAANLQNEVSYASLRSSARNLGADMIGVYRFNSSTHRKDGASVLQLASLGLAPVNSHKSVSAVSLVLMDAKTGYVYGVLEESAKKRTISSSWGNENAEDNTELRAEQAAMDALMKRVPEFWNRTYERHR